MGFWEVVVPVVSVISTGAVAVWSKIIDARTKREDRQHARALDYEGRVWQAKNDALRRLISACRDVKTWAVVYQSQPDLADLEFNIVRLARAMSRFEKGIGGEEGLSEITAYAAEPVRAAVEAMLARFEKDLKPVHAQLFGLGHTEALLEKLNQETQYKLGSAEPGKAEHDERRSLTRDRRNKFYEEISAKAKVDVAVIIELCERTIDVARQDLQGLC